MMSEGLPLVVVTVRLAVVMPLKLNVVLGAVSRALVRVKLPLAASITDAVVPVSDPEPAL